MRHRWKSDFAKKLLAVTDLRTPEAAVAALIDRKLQLFGSPEPPIDLHIVASICDIDPNFTITKMQEDGRLVPKDGKWLIYLNQRHNTSRRRFSAGHEITHRVLHPQAVHEMSCKSIGHYLRKQEEEWLCDFGSSHILLLQKQYVVPIIEDIGYSFSCIQQIIDLFQVSFEAAARAITRFATAPIAIAYYKMGYTQSQLNEFKETPLFPGYISKPGAKMRLVKWYRSNGFPNVLRKNKSIDDKSIIHLAQYQEVPHSREIITFDGKLYFEVDVEARKQSYYSGGQLFEGVIAILSNPTQQ